MSVKLINMSMAAGGQAVELREVDGVGTLNLLLPLRTVSEANFGGKFRDKLKRKSEQRMVAGALLRPWSHWVKFPCVVKLTRLSTGHAPLDDDNLRTALKHVRDGIADALGRDDSHKSGIGWDYRQEPKQKEYGVRVEIAWGGK